MASRESPRTRSCRGRVHVPIRRPRLGDVLVPHAPGLGAIRSARAPGRAGRAPGHGATGREPVASRCHRTGAHLRTRHHGQRGGGVDRSRRAGRRGRARAHDQHRQRTPARIGIRALSGSSPSTAPTSGRRRAVRHVRASCPAGGRADLLVPVSRRRSARGSARRRLAGSRSDRGGSAAAHRTRPIRCPRLRHRRRGRSGRARHSGR